MRSIIVCEGSDDLWFLGYYLNKKLNWDICSSKTWCSLYALSTKKKQEVQYLSSPDYANQVAIFSTGGQDRMKPLIKEWLTLVQSQPSSPIDAIVFFRDCDNRLPDTLAQDMESWFSDFASWLPASFSLKNNEVSVLQNEIDEIAVTLSLLPVIIPFEENGAIETLLLKAIEDSSKEGAYIAQSARNYVDHAIDNVLPLYLNKQRLVTKAKYSAAIAITNPDHSTKLFQQLMESTPWEQSASIKTHMEKVVQLITGQLDLTHTR